MQEIAAATPKPQPAPAPPEEPDPKPINMTLAIFGGVMAVVVLLAVLITLVMCKSCRKRSTDTVRLIIPNPLLHPFAYGFVQASQYGCSSPGYSLQTWNSFT
jgi:hypothetical protein